MPADKRTMKMLVTICFIIVVVELFIGVGALTSGVMYTRLDTARARAVMSLIQENAPDYYTLLSDTEDTSYRSAFNVIFLQRRNPLLVMGGFLFIVMAINTLVPVVVLFYLLVRDEEETEKDIENESRQDGESEEDSGEKKEEDPFSDEF